MLELETSERERIWQQTVAAIEHYLEDVDQLRVTPDYDPQAVRDYLMQFDFCRPDSAEKILSKTIQGLRDFQLHTPHPAYFGLFNPAPTTMGVVADALVGAFNPQLATWTHSPFAVEVERYVIDFFADRFGFPSHADGTFTTGGAEANDTAMLTALTSRFPELGNSGLRGLDKQPVMYVSKEAHHSFLKAAKLHGLGMNNVREIPIDSQLKMDVDKLDSQIQKDKEAGFEPFMVVATAGTTNAGAVDPLRAIVKIARQYHIWCHVDAAWGGAAILIPELSSLLDGIEDADSVTLDAHK